jgi:hypothetical protein
MRENIVDRLIAFLDKAPIDEVYTRDEIEPLLDGYIHSGTFIAQRRRWLPYRAVIGKHYVWGNKRAIAQLQKGLEALNEN